MNADELAYQIGQEVSIAELAANLGMNFQTLSKYLYLFEKALVIFEVNGFSRNLHKGVTKNSRYYLFDNGVRNRLIQNFNPLALRNDVGQLWENFLVMERRKANQVAGRRSTKGITRDIIQHLRRNHHRWRA